MKSWGTRGKILSGVAYACIIVSIIVCGAYFIIFKKDNPSANTLGTYSSNTANIANNSSVTITNTESSNISPSSKSIVSSSYKSIAEPSLQDELYDKKIHQMKGLI